MADDQNTTGQNDDASEVDELDDSDAEALLADAVSADDSGDDSDAGDQQGTDRSDSGGLGDAGKRTLDALRRERKQARDEAAQLKAKLKEYEDADKSESQRLQDQLAEHQQRASTAEQALRRREIAEAQAPEHATVSQIKAVAKRLSGDDDDALEADAGELYELIAPAPTSKTPQRPQERLRGGGDPEEPPEETDPAKLAALVPRRS